MGLETVPIRAGEISLNPPLRKVEAFGLPCQLEKYIAPFRKGRSTLPPLFDRSQYLAPLCKGGLGEF